MARELLTQEETEELNGPLARADREAWFLARRKKYPRGAAVGELLISLRDTGSPSIESIREKFLELDAPDRLIAWSIGTSAGTSNLDFVVLVHKTFYIELLKCFGIRPGEAGVGTKPAQDLRADWEKTEI
jgi:hypothetical protein